MADTEITQAPDSAQLIDPGTLTFRIARKTKPIRACHMQMLISHHDIISKMLLRTLEGNQDLRAMSIVCVGIGTNDYWQQSPDKLFKKYDVTGFDSSGWMICTPKPDNQAEAFCADQITGTFCVRAQWGQQHMMDDAVVHLLFGGPGDYILRNPEDPNDVWIVKKLLFEATYEII